MKNQIKTTWTLLMACSALVFNACTSTPAVERGVVVGESLLEADTLFSQPKLGNITAIKILKDDSLPTQILVVGTKGVSIINEKGDELNHIPFDYGDGYGRFGLGNVQPVFEPDRILYLNRGGGWQPVSLFDENGKKMWEYSGSPNDAALIDLDSNGENEIVVGTNGGGGVIAFNQSGEKVWKTKASNVFSIAVIKENGVNYIIHTDGGEVVIRSVDGKLFRTLDLPSRVFEIDEFNGEQAIFCSKDQHLYVCDFYGTTLDSFYVETLGGAKCINSQLLGVKTSCSIISNTIRRADSEWYLFDHNGSIVYHERYWGHYRVVCEYISGSKVHLLLGCDGGIVKVYSKVSN